jgi:hypothetical protein
MRESRKYSIVKNVIVTAAAIGVAYFARQHLPANWTFWVYPLVFLVWLLLILP